MKENTLCTDIGQLHSYGLQTVTCTFIFSVPKLQHIKNPEPRLHQTHFCLESKDSKSKAHTLLKKKKRVTM